MISRLVDTVLRHAPGWLLDVIEWMLARDSVVLRWIKALSARGVAVPDPVLPDMTASVRVFFGPFNYAGQAWQWARSLTETSEHVSAKNLTVVAPNDLGFTSDGRVPAAVFAGSRPWRRQQESAFAQYTHVVIESFTSTLGTGRNQALVREIDWHRAAGRRVALVCHGTDIRSPERHLARSPHSPFDLTDPATRRLERRAGENRTIIESSEIPVFYSTPDLVHDVPSGRWLPVVIEPQRWESAAAAHPRPGERPVPIVMHAPTVARIKGTEAVERAVADLGGIVEYHPLRGVPAAQMPDHVAAADIVVDQLLLGSYGVAACEAMAAGRVVVGHVDDDVRAMVRERCGRDLPIVQADPDNLTDVLRRLAGDPEECRQHGRRGPEFVRAVHAGDQTLKVMSDFLGAPIP